jgi:thermolysin
MRRCVGFVAAISVALALILTGSTRHLQGQGRVLSVVADNANGVRDWDNLVNRMTRTQELQVRLEREDTLVRGRTIQQLDQFYHGVRVWGGSVSRQLDSSGTAISVFGELYTDMAVNVTPTLTAEDAKAIVENVGGAELGRERLPNLAVLPTDDGFVRLVWVGEIVSVNDNARLFIDANTGALVRRDNLWETQFPNAYVGHGKGVFGDDKKISTRPSGGGFIAFDTLRPPDVSTFDLRSNVNRAIQFLNGVLNFATSDYASTTSSNDWANPAAVDAHVYSSYTYDYYSKRFGRRGLDNADKKIWNLTHMVNRNDIYTAPSALVDFWLNAAYVGNGVMMYGEGLPAGAYLIANGRHYDYFAGAIDIVAHELTHGVTEYTSHLEYRNESGALNEAFSDIMGTSVEFFFQPVGSGLMKADYLIGEDISRAQIAGALNGDRSMENPALYGDRDHYSRRYIGPADNGGVHTNSGIANQAFYLAIEGGVNRTSGIRVQGVGAANREQVEKIFYRAFAQLMPSNANYAMARVITLRAAQDLYGSNTAPYNAVRDAWTAVGVN